LVWGKFATGIIKRAACNLLLKTSFIRCARWLSEEDFSCQDEALFVLPVLKSNQTVVTR
jgi:hypothetical protein